MRRMVVRLLCGLGFCVLAASSLVAQSFKDDDWNVSLYANCALPKHRVANEGAQSNSIVWAQSDGDRKLMFQLLPGDVGGCSSDNQPRARAPYWERSELRQNGALAKTQKHEILFEVSFIRGFTGKRENFFSDPRVVQDLQDAAAVNDAIRLATVEHQGIRAGAGRGLQTAPGA